MIGLVNAVGVVQASRAQSTEQSASVRTEGPEKLAPVLSSEQAANHVLRTAVESIKFQETGSQRGSPDGEESDRAAQTDLEASPSGALGGVLDVTA